MFDSVLRKDTLPKRRFGSGAVLAALVFVGAGAFTAWAQARGRTAEKKEVAVTFVKPPPPPPPPPPAPTQPKPKPKKAEPPKTVQLAQAIVAPTVVPQEKPPEQEPPAQQAGPPGGELGGEVGGVAGGIRGGVVVEAQKGPVEFDPGKMEPPKLLGGPEIRYTEKALEREVQGKMIVKCVVSLDGKVTSCRVLRSLPFMDRAVIDALEKRKYAPALLGGKPVEVDYTFVLNLKLPE